MRAFRILSLTGRKKSHSSFPIMILQKRYSVSRLIKSRKSRKVKHYDQVDLAQISLFDTTKDEDVIKELSQIDISNLTPLDALNTLYKLQNMLKNRWSSTNE